MITILKASPTNKAITLVDKKHISLYDLIEQFKSKLKKEVETGTISTRTPSIKYYAEHANQITNHEDFKYYTLCFGVLSTGDVVMGVSSLVDTSEFDEGIGYKYSESDMINKAYETASLLKKEIITGKEEPNNIDKEAPVFKATSNPACYPFSILEELPLCYVMDLKVPLTALVYARLESGFVMAETKQALTMITPPGLFWELYTDARNKLYSKLTGYRETSYRYKR